MGLRRWGYRDWVGEEARAGAEFGRIVRVDRGECDVVTSGGLSRVKSDSVRAQAETAPVTGDWVELASIGGMDSIVRVLPRKTELSRRDPAESYDRQVLAANADTVGIVAGLDQSLAPGRFERLLVMAMDSGAAILVLLTKVDLQKRRVSERLEVVRSIVGDAPVVTTSAITGVGLDYVRSHLGSGHTLALVGASGSGKSSLVNALAGAEVVATAAVRPKDARGRHTTIARELVLLPDGAGLVLDTPGVRSLGLWSSEDALLRVFHDIEVLAEGCRFGDCSHAFEPSCAVKAAVDRGELSARRLERSKALRMELDRQRDRAVRRHRHSRKI